CEDALGALSATKANSPSSVTLRAMTVDDLDFVAAIHDAASKVRPLAIVRDSEHWEFLLQRAATFFKRLDGTNLAQRFMIAEQLGRPIGSLVAVLAPGEWNLREVGAEDHDPETVAAILEAGAAQARAVSAKTVWGWIPRALWPSVPSWRLK